MPDNDPHNQISRGMPPGPILGAPAPNYNPINLGFSDPGMNMALAMYAPQMLQQFGIISPGSFLPQQFPAQMLMDQMTSAKYMQDSALNRSYFIPRDQDAIFSRLRNMQPRTGPLSALGAEQIRDIAGYINHPAGQMLASSLLGPQNAEDIFFGRRGSSVQFANAVNQFGFYRPDSLTGNDRMSADSLRQFTEQLYGNLYGPNANLNDVSGLSAGRMGTVANELAVRGLMPASLGSMTEAGRKSVFNNPQFIPPDLEQAVARDLADAALRKNREVFSTPQGDKTYEELDYQSQQEILRERTTGKKAADYGFTTQAQQAITALKSDSSQPGGMTTEEAVRNLDGAGSAVRRIDATRVGNTLKDYSGAVDAVRAIFGDNGMGNAPFQQLIASLDALTQGGLASMSPGKLENIMRRTQMASRDSGVSLEALMGLTARGGALADQNGLVRDVVPEQVISTMQRTRAMRDAGSFAPGFGRMDPNTAALFIMDQNARADSSMSSRLAATARRIVKENENNQTFQKNPGAKDLIKMVDAMERGADSFVNEAGETISISQQMGKNPGEFFQKLFTAAGISNAEVSSRLYDEVNTQEFLLPGRAAEAQRYEVMQQLGGAFFDDFMAQEQGSSLTDKGGQAFDQNQRQELALAIGSSFSKSMLDDVNTNMKPHERVAALTSAMRRGVESYVRKNNAGFTEDQIKTETDRLLKGPGGLFKDDDEIARFVQMEQANVARNFEATTGININKFRQTMSLPVLAAARERDQKNRAKADMFEALGGSVTGDGSNFLQRMSDYFVEGGQGRSFADYVLNTFDTGAKQKEFIEAVGGAGTFDAAMKVAGDELSDARIDTETEKTAAVAEIMNATDPAQALENAKKRFAAVPGGQRLFEGKTTVLSDSQLTKNIISEIDTNKNTALDEQLKSLYRNRAHAENRTLAPGEVEQKFSGQQRESTIKELVSKTPGFEHILTATLADNPQAAQRIGLGANVLTEGELRSKFDMFSVAAGSFIGDQTQAVSNQKRIEQVNKLVGEMNQGKIGADTIMSITESGRGALDQKAEESVKAAISTAIEKFNDTTTTKKADGTEEKTSKSMTDLAAELKKTGISEPEQQQIINMTRFARAQAVVGGFKDFGPGGEQAIESASRISALQAAVNSGAISDQKGLGADIRAMEKETDEIKRKEAADRVKAAVSGTDEEYRANLDRAVVDDKPGGGIVMTDDKKSKAEKINEIINEGKQTEETAKGGKANPVGDLMSQIGSAFSKAVADSFKDVKIENVTITNLHMPNLLSGLIGGLSSSSPPTTTAAKDKTKPEKDAKESAPATDVAAERQKDTNTNLAGSAMLALSQLVPRLLPQSGGEGAGKTGALEITGTVTMNGLRQAVLELTPRQAEQPHGGGASVMPSPI